MDRTYDRLKFNIVLYQPEIPANTGNIGRLCVGCNSTLHIIKPMRFLITEKQVQRAGLDYWHHLNLKLYDSLDECMDEYKDSRFFLCSTKGQKLYYDLQYKQGDTFIFGPESRGLPPFLLDRYSDRVIKIPMSEDIRSLNLSNSVAVVLYEACRQTGFRG